MSPVAETAVAVAIAEPELRNRILEAVKQIPLYVLEEDCPSSSIEDLVACAERLRPAILFLGLPGLTAGITETLAALNKLAYAPRVVVVNDTADPVAILAAMRAGAAEFVYPPLDAGFADSMRRVMADSSRPTEITHPKGSVIGFVSAKGGCGATTIACHTAAYLKAAARREILLADLDLVSGISNVLMQTTPRYSIEDAMQSLHRMDLKLWKALVATGPSNVDVISPAQEYGANVVPISRRMPQMLRFWRSHYDFTLIDFGHGMTQTLSDAVESIDTLVLVATNELPALRQAKRMISALAGKNFGGNRVKLVLNRMPKRVKFELPELETVIGHKIHCAIPDEYDSLHEAYSEPRLLQPDTELGRSLGEFATNLAGIAPAPKKARKFFIF